MEVLPGRKVGAIHVLHVPLTRACRKEPAHLCKHRRLCPHRGRVCIFEALWPQSVSGRAAEEETASDACTQILLPKGWTGIQITSSLALSVGLCALTFAASAYSAAFEALPKAPASPS